LVLYGYQSFIVPPPPAAPAESTGSPSSTSTAPTAAVAPSPAQAPAAPRTEDPVSATVLGDASGREITVETATILATLSNKGGRVIHWRLKDYQDSDGQPLDLVPSALPTDQPTPFSLRVDDEGITKRLNEALYQVTGAAAGRVDVGAGGATVVFEFEDASGLHARKEFRFEQRNYLVTFSATVQNGDRSINPTVLWGPGLGDIGAQVGGGSSFTGNYSQPPQGIYDRDAKAERITNSAIAEQPVHEGTFRFAGIDDHYFLAAALNPGQAKVEFRAVTIQPPDQTPRPFVASSFTFAQSPQHAKFFYGPKQFDLLRSVDAELVRAINFGFFGWLAVPLLGALQWIYGFVGNYGWSIVLLTMLISIAVSPLRHKSVVSMRKMQAVQPQMKAIQDRYAGLKATDPARQKMNTEIMALYKDKGVNPAGGCLPMLLQFPVLLAFYSMLSQAIELRGAEFGWWIGDLSQPDPYYVIPVLMAGTMFWQTKITPSTADPAQQRIMMFMPLMFSVMFLWAPSGLVIYWFVSNLWAISQQYFTNWMIGPAPVSVARPAAERQLKNVGASRTGGASKKT
jgi:YidC/Oxa1 family membrane protein insertase